MMMFHRLSASVLGIGYMGKGGGTIAALFCCATWWLLRDPLEQHSVQLIVVGVLITWGIWSAGAVEKEWGHDSPKVVIDELAGMGISLLWLPIKPGYLFGAFILFRVFDIWKPLFIKKMEEFPRGWGVMMDDLLAGLYANFIMQWIVAANFFY
ncbi:MAG: phosphatidylglycerophosphatase A [Bacteroidetes bacterium]|nr:MAG: phosphatidylglycerophosphatase A [Bacteroidota bacterium]